jgi:hypothetical protein
VRAAGGSAGGLIPDEITVGNTSDAATTILDLDTNDRYMRADGDDIEVTSRGQLEMSNVQPLDGVGDMIVDGLVNSNGGTLNIRWSLAVNAGGTMNMLASSANVGWDVTIRGTYTVVGAGQLNIDGDFWKSTTGVFNAGTGTVTFGDDVSANTPPRPSFVDFATATTFFNLRNVTPDKVMRMETGSATTVSGTLTLTGSSCTARASIASDTDGVPFSIAAAAVSANFADIGDSNQTSGSRTATNSWDHSGNTNWTFTTPCTGYTVSGTALQSEGGARWSKCDGSTKNVTISVNGFSTVSTSCSAATGAWSLTTSVEPDQALLAFLDADDAAQRGMTITRAPSPAANVTGLTIVLGQARIRSETASAVTNSQLVKYDDGFDVDVPVDVDQDDHEAWFHDDIEVIIEAGDTYAPIAGAQMTALDISGSLGAADFMSITGSGTSASCTAAVNTSVPVCIRAGGSTDLSGADEFWYEYANGSINIAAATYENLYVDPWSAATYALGTSAAANAVVVNDTFGIDSDAVVSTSAFDSNAAIGNDLDNDGLVTGSGTGTITVGDNLGGGGTFDLTAGTVLIEAAGDDPEICEDSGATYHFWDLTLANVGGAANLLLTDGACTIHVRDDLQVGRVGDPRTMTFNVTAGDPVVDVDDDVIIAPTGVLSASNSATMKIAGDFTNNGTFTSNGGTVEFDAAGTTSSILHTTATSFANLRVLVQPKQLNFQSGRTTTVSSTFTVTGTSCSAPVDLRSTTPGSQYTLNVGTVAFSYATLRDSIAAPTNTAALTGDLGNNTGWTFTGGCSPGPGTMFVNDGSAAAGTANNGAIGSDTFHMSWVNGAAMAFDQQQARVITTPTTNVVGLWQFDTATGQAADTSGNGRTLTLAGSPTSPAGQAGFSQALGLDGATQAANVTNAAFQLSTNFTVEMWVKAPDTTGTKVLSERTSGSNVNWKLEFNGGQLQAHATRNAGATFTVGTSSAPFGDNLWHHVAMTVDSGNTLRLYLDGVSVGTPQAIGGAVWAGAAPVSIGSNVLAAQYFPGQIDDVRISNVARTGPELLGYAKLRDAHNKVIWTSAAQAVTCAVAARCADVVYAGPALHRPGARYYAQARGRLQPWVAYTAWSTEDWFETSALMTVSVPGTVSLGATSPSSNAAANFDIQVTSTVTFGYKVYVSDTSDTDGLTGAGTIADWTGAANAPTTWPVASYGYFGATVLAATGGKDTTTWGTGVTDTDYVNNKYVGVRNTTPSLVYDHPTGTSGGTDTVTMGLRVAAGPSQAPGAYAGNLTVTVLANP